MANKFDLLSLVQSLTGSTAGTDLGLSSVAASKTRFITYVKAECRSAANVITLGEAAAATGALSTTYFSKLVNSSYEYPEEPGNVDHPLFKVDTPGFLGAVTGVSNVSSTLLTIQYYDE